MKKLTSFFFFLSALFFMVALTSCTNKKEKSEPLPNIDSLVDAKVAERLNEAAIDQVIEHEGLGEEDESDPNELDDTEDESSVFEKNNRPLFPEGGGAIDRGPRLWYHFRARNTRRTSYDCC